MTAKNKGNEKAGGIDKLLVLHKIILQKYLTSNIFLFTPAANMHGTNQFPWHDIGCMIWQHAVILESICATKSIIIFFPG